MSSLRAKGLRVLPDSVVGRTALVLVAALMISAAAAVVLFAAQRQEALETIGGRNAAERVAGLVTLAEQLPPDQRQDTLSSQESSQFRVGWGPQPAAWTTRISVWPPMSTPP
ncbi:hypothetical protein [Paramagnetospirillum magneticum]|uniref:hypothetical protein n=1 Tax=Paramagnetospirillum magneticum TaxID=84159 RepID=UPI0002F79031|nr:hypothetical protein [Paramagnetospirillum magneticum]